MEKFTQEHEWLRLEGEVATIGMYKTSYNRL